MEQLVFIIEIIGTIAFAVSGAMVAAKKRMDIFGVIVLGVTTAVGGGMCRDILLGITPPAMFTNSVYVTTAVISALIVFFSFYGKERVVAKYAKQIDTWLNIFDAVGLGIFVVAGVDTALNHGFGELAFLSIFVGTITGIGGGMLRDVLAGQIPVVLHKRVYAVAAILGAGTYYYLGQVMPNQFAMLIGIAATITLRLLATHYEWNLPRIK